jgi:hypothetical protein
MSGDLARVNRWLYTILSNDATIQTQTGGRIYSDEAPQDAAVPMLIFAFLGGSDKLLALRGRLSSVLYLVRAVDEGSSYDNVVDVADRIDELLTTSVPNGGTVVDETRITSCYREQPHQRKDSQFGVPSVYLGGYYRIGFQPASQ